MANYTVGNLAGVIPEMWSNIINEALFPQFVLQKFVTNLSDFVSAEGRIVHVPNAYTNVFTSQAQVSGADLYASAVVAATVDQTITLNTHRYVAWVIGDLELNQLATKYNLNEVYARESAGVLLQGIEDALFALHASLTPGVIGGGTLAIDDLSVRQAIRVLANANFDLTKCAFFFHPNVYYDQLIGLAKISPNNASNMNVMATGALFGAKSAESRAVGMLYGQPVYVSSRVPTVSATCKNLFIHERAFAFATQGGASGTGIRVQMSNELRLLGLLAVVDSRYGVGVLRADAGVVINMLTTGTVV